MLRKQPLSGYGLTERIQVRLQSWTANSALPHFAITSSPNHMPLSRSLTSVCDQNTYIGKEKQEACWSGQREETTHSPMSQMLLSIQTCRFPALYYPASLNVYGPILQMRKLMPDSIKPRGVCLQVHYSLFCIPAAPHTG